MAVVLKQFAPPVLPQGSPEYSKQAADNLNNVQRLFYNQLTNVVNLIIGTHGARYIDCPNALFFSTQDQTLALANTGYPITYNNTYLDSGITVDGTGKIYPEISGIYNFQLTAQATSTSSSAKQIWVWLNRDGTDIGYSTHQYTLSGSGTHLTMEWNFNIDVAAGEYMQVFWGADDTNVTLNYEVAAAPHPGISSAVMAVSFISPLPVVRPNLP